MDLNVKEKKMVCNSVLQFLKYQAKHKVVIFYGTPCIAFHRLYFAYCIFKLHFADSADCNTQIAFFILYFADCSLKVECCRLHFVDYILQIAFYRLHFANYILCFTFCILCLLFADYIYQIFAFFRLNIVITFCRLYFSIYIVECICKFYFAEL